jgi:uncharacterized membrane protein
MMPSPMQPSIDATEPASSAVRATRAVAVGSVLALIALGLAWELWLSPTGGRGWAIKVFPLCFPVAGLLRYRMYTYRWVSLLVWIYFTEGVVRASVERGTGRPLAIIEVVLCLLLFAACAFHVRLRLRKSIAP